MEEFSITYQPLFRVRIRHRYWLNMGATAFDVAGPTPATAATLALLDRQYSVAQFWHVAPDAATRDLLAGNQMLFKPRPDGFTVFMPTTGNAPAEPLPDGATFVFTVMITDPLFWLYTNVADDVANELLRNGRRFRLKNGGGTTLNTSETLRMADLDPPPVPVPPGEPPKPLPPRTSDVGYLELAHRPADGRTLLTGGNVVPDLTFDVLLGNRRTHWEFQGTDLGQFPLVQYGLIDVQSGGRKLPNPTPATTENRSGTYFSRIF